TAKLDLSLTPAPLAPERAMASFQNATGLKLAELAPAEARRAGIEAPRGLVAVDQVQRGSLAQRGGLRRGDIVLAVNSAEVDTLKDFQKAIAQARKSGRAVLLVQRGYQLMELALELGRDMAEDPNGPRLDFNAFVLSLGSSALIHLGEAPDPISGKTQEPDLP